MNKITYESFEKLVKLMLDFQDEVQKIAETLNINPLESPVVKMSINFMMTTFIEFCGKDEAETLHWFFNGGYDEISIERLYKCVINKDLSSDKQDTSSEYEIYQNFMDFIYKNFK